MRSNGHLLLASLLAATLAPTSLAQVQVELTRLEGLLTLSASPNARWVSGVQLRQGPNDQATFRWSTASGLESIAFNPPFFYPTDLSADGKAVLTTLTSLSGDLAGAIWTPTGTTPVPGLGGALGGVESGVLAITPDAGLVAGFGWTTDDAPLSQRGFLWSPSAGHVTLDSPDGHPSVARDLSDDGTVVVGYDQPGGVPPWRMLRWVSGVPSVLADDAQPTALSADGEHLTGSGGNQAIRWSAADGLSTLEQLPVAPGARSSSSGLAISDDGATIVGQQTVLEPGSIEAQVRWFVWREGHGTTELRALLAALGADEFAGFSTITVQDLSADGRTLVGSAGKADRPADDWLWRVRLPVSSVGD